jgi:hypothetical protein
MTWKRNSSTYSHDSQYQSDWSQSLRSDDDDDKEVLEAFNFTPVSENLDDLDLRRFKRENEADSGRARHIRPSLWRGLESFDPAIV